MIPQSFIEELLSRVDIVDVVGRTVQLKKSGANFVACCPFHQEKSPSFSVSPAKQFYHCFGCGVHGDAIGFIMEQQGLPFVEAVEYLAGVAGVTVPQESGGRDAAQAAAAREQARTQKNALTGVLEQAAAFYRQQLRRSPAAIAYLKGRGLSGEVAARFGIGYAPAGRSALKEAFPDYGDEQLLKAGLVIDNDSGQRYDRFRDRIMFPILGRDGTVIGFGGRVLGDAKPKYLNSPETPLFEKGRELYGLAQARRTIRDAGCVIVVEGYMDVVALSQHGIGNAIATLGTATTPVHVQLLFRHTDRVVFCFDGDAAGRKAAWRALENCLEPLKDGKSCAFLFLPEEHDPDSFVRALGQEAFTERLAQAVPLMRFLIDELVAQCDLSSPEGRIRLIELARPLLVQVSAPATGLLLRKEVARLSGVELAELETLFGQSRPRPSAGGPVPDMEAPPPRVAERRPARSTGDNAPSLIRKLLRALLIQPTLAAQLPDGLITGNSPAEGALRAVVSWLCHEGQGRDGKAVLASFAGSEFERSLREAARGISDLRSNFEVEEEFAGVLEQLTRQRRKNEIDRLLEQAKNKKLTPEEQSRLLELFSAQDSRPGTSGADA